MPGLTESRGWHPDPFQDLRNSCVKMTPFLDDSGDLFDLDIDWNHIIYDHVLSRPFRNQNKYISTKYIC